MKSWVKFGLIWGAFMFVMMNIVFPLIDGKGIVLNSLLLGIPVWLVGGLIFGYVSQGRKPKKQEG